MDVNILSQDSSNLYSLEKCELFFVSDFNFTKVIYHFFCVEKLFINFFC